MSDLEARKQWMDPLVWAYLYDREYIERQYNLPPLPDLLTSRPGVQGVARYIEVPAFKPERLYTLVFTPSEIHIEAMVETTGLWWSIVGLVKVVREETTSRVRLELEPSHFDPANAWRRSAVLPLPIPACPNPFRSWQKLKTITDSAPSCDGHFLDGIRYRHRICDRESEYFADWRNPTMPDHKVQVSLVTAYVALLRGAGVYPD